VNAADVPGPMTLDQEIRDFLLREVVLRDALEPDEDLIESDLLDSIGIVTLSAFLETRFGLQVDEDIDLIPDNFRTIEAIAAFVGRKAPSVDAT
jgi:acyl carrier protein